MELPFGLFFLCVFLWILDIIHTHSNQLATTAYYKELLPFFGPAIRGLDGPMRKAVDGDCLKWGQTIYGSVGTPLVTRVPLE